MTHVNSAVPSPELLDRACGCLVGAAIGDAFGMPLEFGPARSGHQQVRDLVSGRLPAGHFTDDTEMMLALAESLLDHRPLDPADLARRFVAWHQAGPADVGIHTAHVLRRIARGEPWEQAVGAVQAQKPESAGNGSVMRCFPVAVAYWDDLEACLEISRLQSRVTHPHPECQAGSAFVNAVIWHMLHGKLPEGAVTEALEDVPDLSSELQAVIQSAPARQPTELKNSGWMRHTLESAVWGLLTTDSYAEAVIQVANLGNDADTAAAVVGAMAGATYGPASIPIDWQHRLHGPWPAGSDHMWEVSDFVCLAGDLLEQ